MKQCKHDGKKKFLTSDEEAILYQCLKCGNTLSEEKTGCSEELKRKRKNYWSTVDSNLVMIKTRWEKETKRQNLSYRGK